MRAAIVCGLLLTVTGCGDDERSEPAVVLEPRLTAAGSCAELEQMIESVAIREMNADVDAIIDDIEGGDGGHDVAFPSAPSAAPSPAPAGEAKDYTTTNTQERGVDEFDLVKNDGSRIFVLQGRLLLGLASWPPESTRIVSETEVEGQPYGMILDRDRLVVFSGVFMPGLGAANGPDGPRTASPPVGPTNCVKVTLLDVSSATPRVIEAQYLQGYFLDARRVGRSVHLVTGAARGGPELLYWPEERVDWSSRSAARAAMERVREENLRRIRRSVAADWLPRAFVATPGGLAEVERDCASFASSDARTRLGFTTISTVDLSGSGARHATLLAKADLVYASSRFLYLAVRHEWYRFRTETKVREDYSYVFQYEMAQDGAVRAIAAGNTPGTILNSFSMDEEGGYLRVATTRSSWLGWRQRSATNGVSVLRASGGRLEQVGELSGLARDERLYAARFEGPRGFLVTFRNVDPLFTLDLADPGRPRAVGELKVPGYSTYLHMLDAGHLLTVGRTATPDGRLVGGPQLQVFDVSSLDAPALRHQYALGSRFSSSSAEYDHKAFTYFPARALLALPSSDWSKSRTRGFLSTLELLRVTAATGIALLGFVEHSDLVSDRDSSWPGFSPQISRSILADDYVYSISMGGLKVHDTRQLGRALATVRFPEIR